MVDSTGPALLGFQSLFNNWEWRNAAIRWHTITLGVPWWPIAACFFMRPLFRLFCQIDQTRLQRKPMINTTHCVLCGYDLRASPIRCPECGTIRPKDIN